MHDRDVEQETPFSSLTLAPTGLRVRSMVQPDPFDRSAKVAPRPERLTYDPTATHDEAPTHDSETSWPLRAEGFGVGLTDHPATNAPDDDVASTHTASKPDTIPPSRLTDISPTCPFTRSLRWPRAPHDSYTGPTRRDGLQRVATFRRLRRWLSKSGGSTAGGVQSPPGQGRDTRSSTMEPLWSMASAVAPGPNWGGVAKGLFSHAPTSVWCGSNISMLRRGADASSQLST
jgi:hypothetical protein